MNQLEQLLVVRQEFEESGPFITYRPVYDGGWALIVKFGLLWVYLRRRNPSNARDLELPLYVFDYAWNAKIEA